MTSASRKVGINGFEVTIRTLEKMRVRLPEPGLKSRATTIVEVESTGSSDDSLVVKVYWPELSRHNEALVIAEAYRRLSLPQESTGHSDARFTKNLPLLHGFRDVPCSNTGNILQKLGVKRASKQSEERILRLLLFKRLIPLYKISAGQFMDAFHDCFMCHYALWKKGVEHGDISAWNLMWDPKKECGVLNDWDLAFVRDGIEVNGVKMTNGRGRERTGTAPFMACELLFMESDDMQRLYRYEVESFIWIFVYICIRRSHPEKVKSWREGSNTDIGSAKSGFLNYTKHWTMQVDEAYEDAWKIGCTLLQLLVLINTRTRARPNSIRPQLDDELLYNAVIGVITSKIDNDMVEGLPLVK